MILYKYLTPERIDVLKNRKIRYTQPAAFNDPFESALGQREMVDRSIVMRYQDFMHARIVGILSLTKKRENLVMWAHYALSHQGFVIAFDSQNAFFSSPARPVDDSLAPPKVLKKYRHRRGEDVSSYLWRTTVQFNTEFVGLKSTSNGSER